jgi:hypothetical protein
VERVDLDWVDDWLGERMGGPPPPAYELVPWEPDRGAPPQAMELWEHGLEVLDVDRRSGGIAFSMPAPLRTSADGVEEALVAACRRADEREYFPEQAGQSEATMSALRSAIPGTGLRVVGPGGGVILVEAAEAIHGKLTVRRRGGEREAAGWRPPSELASRLRAAGAAEVALNLEIGYFEASSREEQRLLRPVVLALLDHEPSEANGFDVGWRQLWIEPATDLGDIPPDAGIGLWYEPKGGIGD